MGCQAKKRVEVLRSISAYRGPRSVSKQMAPWTARTDDGEMPVCRLRRNVLGHMDAAGWIAIFPGQILIPAGTLCDPSC